jgi:hypothetical protein
MRDIKQIVDPAFLRESNYSYVKYNDKELATVLCFALARNNNDLILHQQRIELYAKNKQQTLTFSAIIDLFIALKDKGFEYKKRILDKYRDHINSKQAIILTKALVKPLSANTPIKEIQESIFNTGTQGPLLSSQNLNS